MPTKLKIILPQIDGLQALSPIGTVGVVNIKPELGYRIHQFDIVYVDGGGAPTDILALIGDIVVWRNGVAIRTHTAAELDYLNQLNGTQYARQQVGAGAAMRQTLRIYFAEPWRKDKADTDMLAFNAGLQNGVNRLQIKITLIAALPATASIYAQMRVDSEIAPPKGVQWNLKKVYRQSLTASGTTNDFSGTLDTGDKYQVIALRNPTGAYVQYATLKLNGNLVFERQRMEDNIGDLVQLGINPLAGQTLATAQTAGNIGFPIVLDADDPLNSALDTTGGVLWLKTEYSAAATGNVSALIERLGTPDH